MKQLTFRLWCANALIVAATLVLTVLLAGALVPAFARTATALLPALAAVVCVCAIAFALLEAILLYRSGKSDATSQEETEAIPPQDEPDQGAEVETETAAISSNGEPDQSAEVK